MVNVENRGYRRWAVGCTSERPTRTLSCRRHTLHIDPVASTNQSRCHTQHAARNLRVPLLRTNVDVPVRHHVSTYDASSVDADV